MSPRSHPGSAGVSQMKLETLGFRGGVRRPARMSRAHLHNEVEINYVFGGRMVYLFNDRVVTVPAKRFTVFWGAAPHQLIEVAPGMTFAVFTIPLSWVLQWQLPRSFVGALMAGRVLADVSTPDADELAVRRWSEDLSSGQAARAQVAALEIEARIRRLTLADPQALRQPADRRRDQLQRGAVQTAERLARYICEHYTEPFRVADAAAAVGLHPNYVMALFRRTCGMSLIDYLTRQRVSHAQRLLATTDKSVLDIALASGFGSLSRFYEAFNRLCDRTPLAYRAAMRAG